LYPFPEESLRGIMQRYSGASQCVWAQEEPMNQGAWYSILHHLNHCLQNDMRFAYAGREAASAPASGYASLHQAEQGQVVIAALGEHE
jgi:2-oxoglutarate dehydrogenase E1 component